VPRKTLLALALALAASATPPVKASAKGILLLTEILPSPVKPLSLLTTREPSTVALKDGSADLYPGSDPTTPGIVLVHGAAKGGPADPRVHALATALNKLGRTVLVPSLALGELRLDRKDTDRIAAAIDYLAERTGRKVLVLSFSFGAAYTLVALEEEPGVQSRVLEVATVGTYFDLVHLLQGVTAGRVVGPGGRTQPWRPDSRARSVVTDFLKDFVEPAQAEALPAAVEHRNPAGLGPEAMSVYNLMTNTDPARTRDLVKELPGGLPEVITGLSPSHAIDRIRVPVRAFHSRQDPASPPSESELLVQSLGPGSGAKLTIVGSFRHVTIKLTPASLLEDAVPLLGFAGGLMRTQEGWGYSF
jgi:pimeloyl-ACP methyl ester carboxylesterase